MSSAADATGPQVPQRCGSLLGSFLLHADRRPSATALVWRGERVSYGGLLGLALRARAALGRPGPREGGPVGIVAPKSPEAVALILACLLAGRRFIVPSPTLPAGSLRKILDRAGCTQVLSASDIPAGPATGHRIQSPAAGPDEVGFMLTTSGSTGLPKIVPLSTGAVDRFTTWAGQRFGIGPGVTVLNYAPLNFDLCLLEIWATLKHGGQVVLADPTRGTDAGHLARLIADNGTGLIQAVPMFYRLLADWAQRCDQRFDTVEHVVFTGDTMPARCLAALPRMFRRARLYNVYGCTETNDSFLHEVDPARLPQGPVPLGRPLPGVSAAVITADGTVLDGPGTGELYVATPFQTAGYLGEAAGSSAFTAHPGGDDGLRYFRSGDLVHRDGAGRLFLAGRTDAQVKVRGLRVSIQEVEQALLEHPSVTEAVVVAVPDAVAGRLLRCVVRRAPGSGASSLLLRQFCAQRLPPAAIPSTMRVVDEPLPRTATGKADHIAVARDYFGHDRTKEW